jgi:hypothetical protein
LQKEFHSLGGKIYRIFLRGYDNRDSPEEFAEIISYMRQSDVVNAFYLDVQNDKDESIARHSDDCLLVKFDGAIYAFVARVKWHKGKGVIVNSTIELGSNAFVFRRSRWLKLIERLRALITANYAENGNWVKLGAFSGVAPKR